MAVGHDGEGNPVPKTMSTEMNAAYSLHCTPTDLATFANFVMEQPDNHPLRLQPDLHAQMLTPQIAVNDSMFWHKDWPKPEIRRHDSVFWGLGWGLVKTANSLSFWHWGDNDVTKAFVVAFPARRQGIVMMGNSQNAARIWSEILRQSIGETYPGLHWLKNNLGL